MGKKNKIELPSIPAPANADITTFMEKLAEMPGPPAVALLLEDNCEEYLPPILKVKLPKPLNVLFNQELVGRSLEELVYISKECYDRGDISVFPEQVEPTNAYTKDQSGNRFWYTVRSFRITASKFKQVVRTSVEHPSISLLKQICYLEAFQFSTEATR